MDEERCLIQQIALERNEVMQMVKIPRVKAILSKDKRNDQRRTWYLSHKEKNVGKIHVVRPSVVKGKFHLESCVFVEGLQVVQREPPKVCQSKFCFCPIIFLPSAIPTMVKPSIFLPKF